MNGRKKSMFQLEANFLQDHSGNGCNIGQVIQPFSSASIKKMFLGGEVEVLVSTIRVPQW